MTSPRLKKVFGGFLSSKVVHRRSKSAFICSQIIDGLSNTTVSNRNSPGFFCGEAEQAQTFISETPSIRVVFRVSNFSEATYWSFDIRSEPQLSIYRRHGQRTGGFLYKDRRGSATPGTYCDRTFTNCRLQTCSVQSAAYPGVPRRGLRCRCKLSTSRTHIKLYLENEEFNVGGQRCENAMTCPMGPVSFGKRHFTSIFFLNIVIFVSGLIYFT